uniref:Uncharacterized protein n=1 Tax=Arundo donax TaxID=35708 RepID=A0A0A9BHT2_ARUDO
MHPPWIRFLHPPRPKSPTGKAFKQPLKWIRSAASAGQAAQHPSKSSLQCPPALTRPGRTQLIVATTACLITRSALDTSHVHLKAKRPQLMLDSF